MARVEGPGGRRGALFVEAKGHRRELTGRGTRATAASRTAITSALHDVQNRLDVPPGTEWLGPVYQPANRLAWIWYAREHPAHAAQPVDAWLVSVYFLGGVYPWGVASVDGPADEQAWRPFIDGLHQDMGLPSPAHALSDRVVELFLAVATARSDR